MKKDKIDNKTFRYKEMLYTYNYPSMMCDLNEVHKGIITKYGAFDLCVPYNEAVAEIKKFEEEGREEK